MTKRNTADSLLDPPDAKNADTEELVSYRQRLSRVGGGVKPYGSFMILLFTLWNKPKMTIYFISEEDIFFLRPCTNIMNNKRRAITCPSV